VRFSLQLKGVSASRAGTGLLGLALAPLARIYTMTDIKPFLLLIQENTSLNSPGWHDGFLGNSWPTS